MYQIDKPLLFLILYDTTESMGIIDKVYIMDIGEFWTFFLNSSIPTRFQHTKKVPRLLNFSEVVMKQAYLLWDIYELLHTPHHQDA